MYVGPGRTNAEFGRKYTDSLSAIHLGSVSKTCNRYAYLIDCVSKRNLVYLQLFCHVSTAYCHLHERHLKEKPYAPPADPHKIIKAVEWMDEEVVDSMTDK